MDLRFRQIFSSLLTPVFPGMWRQQKQSMIDGQTNRETEGRKERWTGEEQSDSYVALCFAGSLAPQK